MIEYGLSVSLESSPRTPNMQNTPKTPKTPKPMIDVDSPSMHNICNAPIRKKLTFNDLIDNDVVREEDDGRNGLCESISPRILFDSRDYGRVARQLDFSGLSLDDHFNLSPVTRFRSVSMTRGEGREVERGGEGGEGGCLVRSTNEKKEACVSNCDCASCSVGECSVCYMNLPLRANHVFTVCGHLFCTRCILKWWDSSTTCPVCRAELYDADADTEDDDTVADADDDTVDADDADDDTVDADVDAADDAVVADNRAADEYIINIINNDINHAIQNDEQDVSDDDDDEGLSDDEVLSDDDEQNHENINNVSLINRYRYLDCEWNWNGIRDINLSNPNFDDTLYPLSQEEIQGLRENRDIATLLFGRMRFRETLFHTEQFLGHVWRGTFVSKDHWININSQFGSIDNRTRLFEFVIRRGCDTSPDYEVNIFGFITDVTIQQIVQYVSTEHLDTEWENHVEYAFVADVFTPTDFYLYHEERYRSYGGYNMDEGTLTTQKITIPFSHVRRIYRICPHERRYA